MALTPRFTKEEQFNQLVDRVDELEKSLKTLAEKFEQHLQKMYVKDAEGKQESE